MSKPIIAAVSGVVAGAGLGIALSADIVLAQHTTRFVLSFAKVGLSVDAGLGWTLTKSIGSARTRGLLLTGGSISGENARDAGLIWKSLPEDALLPEAEALTHSLAKGARLALASVKKAIAIAEAESYAGYLAAEAALQGAIGRSADYREGVLAFLERCDPTFGGK